MKTVLRIPFLLLLICATSAHAQLYKWVSPDGKVTYSDMPPPAVATQAEKKSVVAESGSDGGNLPYEVAQAVKSQPVVLYTTAECVPCDHGRKLLTARGIPFSEKTVSTREDLKHLRDLGGSAQLPLLRIGRDKHEGFDAGTWNLRLTAAGYPETSRLPKNYRQRAPEPATTMASKSRATESQNMANSDNRPSLTRDTALPPATGNAPPGFRF